jgi:hypothetical protein
MVTCLLASRGRYWGCHRVHRARRFRATGNHRAGDMHVMSHGNWSIGIQKSWSVGRASGLPHWSVTIRSFDPHPCPRPILAGVRGRRAPLCRRYRKLAVQKVDHQIVYLSLRTVHVSWETRQRAGRARGGSQLSCPWLCTQTRQQVLSESLRIVI